jgi:hypothetical protein
MLPNCLLGGWCSDGKFRQFWQSWNLPMCFGSKLGDNTLFIEWIKDNFEDDKYFKDFEKISERKFLDFKRDEVKQDANMVYYLDKDGNTWQFWGHSNYKKLELKKIDYKLEENRKV